METFSALLAICAGNSSVMTLSFDVFFDLRLNKQLIAQWWGWWFETPSNSLWCHPNGLILQIHAQTHWFICSPYPDFPVRKAMTIYLKNDIQDQNRSPSTGFHRQVMCYIMYAICWNTTWGRCLEQGQVITSHNICGMKLIFPVLDTCFWHISPQQNVASTSA